ncbi:HAMP domain-containing sensor histidine kinase [Eubacteriaceae bacterium ES3]|nr:HAMP domain-containing sensor histidine kinase [Eubacteriaceae bacterium ES3]
MENSPVSIRLNEIRNRVADGFLIGIVIVSLPAALSNVSRMLEMGVNIVDISTVAFIIILGALFLLRKRVNIYMKISTMLLVLTIINFLSYQNNGLLSMGAVQLLFIAVMGALLLPGNKYKVLIVAYTVLVYVYFGYMYTSGQLQINYDAIEYMTRWSSWSVQLFSGEGLIIASVIAISYMVSALKTSIYEVQKSKDEMEQLLWTENQRLEEMVEERTKNLEETTKELMNSERLASLGSLVAGVAHEINTPVGVAVSAGTYLSDINNRAYQNLVAGNFGKDDLITYMQSVEETAEIINENLGRSANLVKSFKEISVNQTNDLLSVFNVKEYLETVILTLKHELKNTSHVINIKSPDNLRISGYPSAFSQIFTNLIMNSLLHGFEDKKDGIIDIVMEIRDQDFVVTYRDNGKGISEENVQKIFDPFFTTKRGQGGSGLGLSVIHSLVVERLKGRISCESREGQYTLFTIIVPDIEYEQE